MPQLNPIPTKIELRRSDALMDISFNNGESFTLSFEYLRVYSPSAEVRGHAEDQAILQTGKRKIGVERIDPVGNYAVCIVFDDGHQTGLYTWDWLYELSMQQNHLWQNYLEKLRLAGASRDPPKSSSLKILN
jgi:DUF971 family protein